MRACVVVKATLVMRAHSGADEGPKITRACRLSDVLKGY